MCINPVKGNIGTYCDKCNTGKGLQHTHPRHNLDLLKLENVKYGYSEVYWCGKNNFYCSVIASHPADGACLIVEKLDPRNELDITNNIAYSEACYLTKMTATGEIA